MLLFFFSKGVITLAMDIFSAFDKEQKFDRRPDFGRDIQKKRTGIVIDIQISLIFFEEISYCRNGHQE